MIHRMTTVASMLAAGLFSHSVSAVDCDMSLAFKQKDSNATGGSTAVWSDKQGSALLFIDRLNVNTDGTRRSYRVDDFWGERVALNNLCNAMSDGCAGLGKDALMQRRVATQDAASKGWPADLLAKTRLSPSIIPMVKGKPCPLVDGFLVSATALHKPHVNDACELSNYVDALVVPALVIPKGSQSGFAIRQVVVGDLAVTVRVGTSKSERKPVFAVIGDTGPVDALGEGSIALNAKLLGKTTQPSNYKEVKTWTVPPTAVLLFAKTRNADDPWMTTDRIDEAATKRFEAWGGLARMDACIAAYRS